MPVSFDPKITCDSCGIEKKEVNHWFVIRLSLKVENFPEIIISSLSGPLQRDDYFVCGLDCLHKELSKLIQEMKL